MKNIVFYMTLLKLMKNVVHQCLLALFNLIIYLYIAKIE